MGEKINFRYNVLNINSVDTFANVSGGFTNNTRDVYFVRALGESADFTALIDKLDNKLIDDMNSGRLKYLRIQKLPILKDLEESTYYSGVYDAWKKGSPVFLKKICNDEHFANIIAAACDVTLKKYSEAQPSVTDSMIRNFATKLLFWIDSLGKDIFDKWSERAKIKIVADNVVKEQEYLFYYCLTNFGIDVLLLQNREDVNVTEALKSLSVTFKTGAYGSSILKEFVPAKSEKKNDSRSISNVAPIPDRTGPVIVSIPEHPGRRKAEVKPASLQITQDTRTSSVSRPANNIASPVVPARTVQNIGESREKSFEELAMLASSIVLIGVHDSNGGINATGSGIMIGRDGYILTNFHVVRGGSFFSVRIEEDDNVYTTNEVIKYNSSLDLAIIRIKKNLNPIPVYRGNKKLVRGQKVVAIGSPLGLFNSVSDGIISGFRTIKDVDMIQFTAPISHGSSGGAVLNMQGEVIGISTAGIDSGQNINLAVGYENIRMFASGFIK